MDAQTLYAPFLDGYNPRIWYYAAIIPININKDHYSSISYSARLFAIRRFPWAVSTCISFSSRKPQQGWDNNTAQDRMCSIRREEVVSATLVKGHGIYEEMQPHVVATEGRKVALVLRTERGEHDIGRVDGVQDAIGRMSEFYD